MGSLIKAVRRALRAAERSYCGSDGGGDGHDACSNSSSSIGSSGDGKRSSDDEGDACFARQRLTAAALAMEVMSGRANRVAMNVLAAEVGRAWASQTPPSNAGPSGGAA